MVLVMESMEMCWRLGVVEAVGCVEWMRDGEGRAGAVFNVSGAGGSLENQTQSALRSSRNIKGDFASNPQLGTSDCKAKAAAPLAR